MHRHLARFAVAASLVTLAACTQATEESVDESADAIVGGVEAIPGAWAGTVALYKGGGQTCGGSLIRTSVYPSPCCPSATIRRATSRAASKRDWPSLA